MVFVMWIVWSLILTSLFIVMVYRGTLTIHEEDQLFLGDVAQHSHEKAAQEVVVSKINHLQPMVKILSGASAVATVVLVGYYVLDALTFLSHHA